MQRRFLEKHGIVFPKEVEYTTYSYEYTSGKVVQDEEEKLDEATNPKDPKDPNDPNDPNDPKERSSEEIHCLVQSNDHLLRIRMYSSSYLRRYLEANGHNRYVYIPLVINGNGWQAEYCDECFITKYVVIDSNRSKAMLFDPMGGDIHMLSHSMYYRKNSIDYLLSSYFSNVEIVYKLSELVVHNVVIDSNRILSWCLWLVKNLIQERNYPGDAYEVLLSNLNKIPGNCVLSYIDRFTDKYLKSFDVSKHNLHLNQSVVDADFDTTDAKDLWY